MIGKDDEKLFAEWRADYAARREADGLQPLPSPPQIAAGDAGGTPSGKSNPLAGEPSGEFEEEARQVEFEAQYNRVRPITRNLIDAIMLDTWPSRPAAIVDFGLDSQEHYEALYYPVREGDITPEALDDALGHGAKLTALARDSPSNPHKEVTFSTSWDVIYGRDGQADGATPGPLPSPSEIARSNDAGPTPSESGQAAKDLPSPGQIAGEPTDAAPQQDQGQGIGRGR